MNPQPKTLMLIVFCGLAIAVAFAGHALASQPHGHGGEEIAFPRSLESYDDGDLKSIGAVLKNRIDQEPFNLVATLIFVLAIIHTFMASKFLAVAHKWEHEHEARIEAKEIASYEIHLGARVFHFLGEVEVIFGLWAVALAGAIVAFHDWNTLVYYVGNKVNFNEAIFIVVIMTLASTRPILRLAEFALGKVAGLLGGTLSAQWFTIMTVGPLMGSFITEPAAMTLCALLLGRSLYDLKPSESFKYATLGLLFVNVSVGGTLTNFAAPPVLMVAGPWGWSTGHMMAHFGIEAMTAILISNTLYFLVYRQELKQLEEKFTVVRLKGEIQKKYLRHRDMNSRFREALIVVDDLFGPEGRIQKDIAEIEFEVKGRLEADLAKQMVGKNVDPNLVRKAFDERFQEVKLRALREDMPRMLHPEERGYFHDPDWDDRDDPVPAWVMIVHICFLGWTIVNAHHPALFVAGMLFFLGFAIVTDFYQNRINLKPALLVGFFLGGLVFHGGVQAWWIAPILGSLTEIPLLIGATALTAFNDNAAITFLATLVPGFTDELKHAVVAGAVTGGGLTIIANAPNPAGVSLLKKYFAHGIGAGGIFKGAIVPTLIMMAIFLISAHVF
ncbi:MAG: putative Na+/H+ antiporter [Desulfobacterales bacterium]|nr:putative Na+/H+ antiporter [Desulfobacterales bacterium]MDJ0991786.1 putative Na+/H+ antiporter [Desulfobacterales bacterium]